MSELRLSKFDIAWRSALEKLLQEKVKTGLYNNASEVVREALRLMKESEEVRRAKLKRLKAALKEGEADISAGRVLRLRNDEELDTLFATL